MDYTIKKIRKGGRVWYKPEFADPGYIKIAPSFATEEEAHTWTQQYIAAKEAGTIQPAREVEQKPAAPAARPTQRSASIDRSADKVARLTGLPNTTKADGRCHYCGLPLNRRGYCEECV